MTPKSKLQHGSYLLSIAALAGGLAFLVVTIYLNLQFGYSLGLSQEGKFGQGALSIGIDCAFALFSAITGYFIVRGRWFTIVPLIITILCGAYSLSSLVGWSASERVAKSNLATANAKAEQNAGELSNAKVLRQWEQSLEWLRSTVVKTEDRRERSQLLTSINQALKEPPTVKAVKSVDTIVTDAQADVLAKVAQAVGFNVKNEDVMLVMVLWIAALAILVKGALLMFGAYLWPRRVPTVGMAAATSGRATLTRRELLEASHREVTVRANNANNINGKVTVEPTVTPPEVTVPTVTPEQVTVEPTVTTGKVVQFAPARKATGQNDDFEGPPPPSASAKPSRAIKTSELKSALWNERVGDRRARVMVKRFLKEQTVPMEGAEIFSSTLNKQFEAWRVKVNLPGKVSQTSFGRQLNKLNVRKIRRGGGKTYYLGLVPAQEVPAAIAA